jgi:ribosome modulation factor
MAKSLTEPSRPNVSKATRQAAMRELADLQKAAATAAAKVRNAYKRWDKQGVTSSSIKESLRARDLDPEQLMEELRESFAAYDAAGHTLSQDDLFPDTAPPVVRAKEAQEHIEWEAGEAGWRAGFHGVSIDDAPFPAGSALRVKWVERWHDGQTDAVARSFGEPKKKNAAGAMDVQPATADRKRPEKKPTTNNSTPPEAPTPADAETRSDPDAEEFA